MAISTRADQLRKLANQFPVANQRVTNGLREAQKTQMQEMVRQAKSGAGTTAQTQAFGAGQVQQAGQRGLQAAQQQQTQAAQVGQLDLQQQARQQRQTGFEGQIALTEKQREIANQLDKLSRDKKNELIDKQLTFNKDQAGQTLLNNRQTIDWALTQAKSAEDFANYAQEAMHVNQRYLQLLQAANDKITQRLQQEFRKSETEKNQKLQTQLAQQKRALDAKIKAEQNKAANEASAWNAGGSIFGAIIGAVASGGNPVGAAAGAGMGAGIGSTVGGLVNG